MFYDLEQMLWSGLENVQRELPSLLRDRRAWHAFEEDSLVSMQAVAIKVSFHNVDGYLALSRFYGAGSSTFRRYRVPFVVRVLEGSYWEYHEERMSERPPRFLTTRQHVLTGRGYGCFSPYCWQAMELEAKYVSNLVLTGPRFPAVGGDAGYAVKLRELGKFDRDRLLHHFESIILH